MVKPSSQLVALVVLPEAYNPDSTGRRRPIEDEKFAQTMRELAAHFGGGALWRFRAGSPRGYWWSRGVLYEDELAVIEVDIPQEPAARAWLRRYARQVLIPRFEQEAVYIKLIGPVETILVTVR
jgi:hypothetical protein